MHSAALALVMVLAACSGGGADTGNAAVPREHAFPRMSLYDTVYHTVKASPVCFEVNAGAEVLCRDGACDIHYPRYNTTVYVGVAAVKPDNGAIAGHWTNRLERMALNLNGVPAHYDDLETPSGSVARLVIADGLTATPVQGVYADTVSGIVVSVAAFMHDGTLAQRGPAAVDSLRPVTEAITCDISRLLRTIRRIR